MRKINKSKILSTEYKEWENTFEKNNEPHNKYNSTANKYYRDVVMNLLFCQKGLCAYTEVQLCPLDNILQTKWTNGQYKDLKKSFNGELEHFDEALKSKRKDTVGKKDWLWSNFFMVDSDTNNRKGTKKVDYILKPDSADYNEFELLDYNTDTHIFVANLSLSENKRNRINYMLNEVLGINFPNLIDKRKNTIKKAIEFGTECYENEFPTAFEFYKRNEKR